MAASFASTPDVAIDTTWRRIFMVAAGGSAINLAVAAVASTALGMTFAMPAGAPNPTIPLPLFAVVTFVPVVLGAAIARFLARFGRRVVATFIVIGAGVAILSATLPFTLPVSVDAALVMVATHLIAAVTFVAASSGARHLAR